MIPGEVKQVVAPYVYPIFEQHWSMFAPCPSADGKIKLNIKFEGGETGWFYPNKSAQDYHRKLRATHHGEIAILELNLIYWAMADKMEFNLQYDEVIPYPLSVHLKDGYSYILFKRFIYGVARNLELTPVSANLVCEIEEVDSGVKGDLIFPEFKWTLNE
jgi:hypothetical protein